MEVPPGVSHNEAARRIAAGEIRDLVWHRQIRRAAGDINDESQLQRRLHQREHQRVVGLEALQDRVDDQSATSVIRAATCQTEAPRRSCAAA